MIRPLVLGLFLLAWSGSFSFGQDEAPILHLGFERSLTSDGTSTGAVFDLTAEQCGTDAFVPGIVGRGFHRLPSLAQDPTIHGPVLNALEGTFSFWGKPPAGWKNTDFNGPAFFRFFLPGSECLFYRVYNQLAVYESRGPQMTWMEDHFLADGAWRMMTFVYKQGYRGLYVDDVPVFENRKAGNDLAALAKGEHYAEFLALTASPCFYDEISTWDKPFSPGEVAALFYSRRPIPLGMDSRVTVPMNGAVTVPLGYNGFTGARIDTPETVAVTLREGVLACEYRLPLPTDYVAEKTRLGGSFFKSTTRQRDDAVWTDDSVEVDLSPDNGTNRYRFVANMAGVLFDAHNDDPVFNHAFTAVGEETNGSWVMRLTVPLAGLGGAPNGAWRFNAIRYGQRAGSVRHQAFYTRGAPDAFGTLQAGTSAVSDLRIAPLWDARNRTLTVEVAAHGTNTLTLEAQLDPLDHRTLFPDDKAVNVYRDKQPVAPGVKDTRILTPVNGQVRGHLTLSLDQGNIALATVRLTDGQGRVLFSDSGLAPCREDGTLQLKYIPSQCKLYAEVTLPSAATLVHRPEASFELRAVGGKKVLGTRRIETMTQVSQEVCFDMAAFPLGEYEVTTTLRAGGRALATLSGTMIKQADPEWVGNEIGVMKAVPEPWTPVRVRKRPATVDVWGRTTTFDAALLPTSLVALDQELLAAPVRVTAEVDGQPVELHAESVRIKGADAAGLRANITGRGTVGALAATVIGWIEFDGFQFMRVELSAPRGKPVMLNNVAVEIPLRPEQATLYDISGYSLRIRAGRLPKEGATGDVGLGQRVGTEERGVQWSVVANEAWLTPGSPTLFITPTTNSVRVKLVLANRAITVRDTTSFEFGLQALPFRPYPRELRNTFLGAFPLDPAALTADEIAAISAWKHPMVQLYTEGWSGKWNYLHLAPDALLRMAEATRSWFVRGNTFPALYLNTTCTDGNTPEYVYYQNEWSPDGTATPNLAAPTRLIRDYPGHDGTVEPRMARCTASSLSYREFYSYWLDKVFTAYQSVSNPPPVWVYFDNSGIAGSRNPYLGCDRPGSLDALLATREYMKRMRTIVHGHSPRNTVTVHNSGARVAAVYGLCDVWIEGEQFTAAWADAMVNNPALTFNDCYPTVLSLDKVRAMYNPHVWTPYAFLSQFWSDVRQKEDEHRAAHPPPPGQPYRGTPTQQRRFRYLSGLMRVNDVSLWGELTPPVPTYARMIEWGWGDQVEFVPYWNPRGAFEFEPGESNNVAVSAWYRPDGGLLMAVFNGGKAAATVRIRLHPKRFPVALRPFVSAFDMTSPDPVLDEAGTAPETFSVRDNALSVPVRAEDYRLLRFDEQAGHGR